MVLAEVLYVILFNLALQLPMTQSLVNQIRPEKFNVTWGNAWTWYPFRFHIRDAAGSGQSRSQQWGFETASVSASIAVLPLFFKRVWINNVQVADSSYYQRPRLKPDKDYSELLAYYPSISSREVTDADTTPKKMKKPWHVDIEDIRLDGQFDYWVHQFRGQSRGTLDAELDVVSRGGAFSLTVPDIDLELDQHQISGMEMFRRGQISGEVAFEPFVPRENKGGKLLQFLLMNADVDLQVNSLAFINLFTRNFKTMKMDGTGTVKGHIHMERGHVLDETELTVEADNLNVGFLTHVIKGNGEIHIGIDPDEANQFDMDVLFNDVVMSHGGGQSLFSGLGLRLNYRTEADFFQDSSETDDPGDAEPGAPKKPFQLEFEIPTVGISDVSVFNYYLPPASPFQFSSGTADLTVDILLQADDADGLLSLKADAMQARVDEQMIQTDFRADFTLVDGVPDDRFFDIRGTKFHFENVKVDGEDEDFDQKNWAALIEINQAELNFDSPFALKTEAALTMTDSRPIVAVLGNQNDRPKWVKKMLTIEDVTGVVQLEMAENRILIPNAFLESEKIDFGAKGVIDEGLNDGVLYARYKKLDIVVKFSDGKRNIDLYRAKGKFDEYLLPSVTEQTH